MQNKYNITKNDDEKFNFVLLDKSDIPQIKNLLDLYIPYIKNKIFLKYKPIQFF